MSKLVYVAMLTLLFPTISIYGQLTIEECRQKAQQNYPLVKQYGLIEKSKEYTLSNAGKGYLPQLSISAKASYQSDVTEIPIKLPGMEIDGLRKDQYQAALELNQVIWDGGNIHAQKTIAKAHSNVENKKLDVDMYALNECVNQLFFGILLMNAQLEQNTLFQQQLQRNYLQVNSYVENGIANQADLDAVKVEQLNSTQRRNELEASRKAYQEMLSAMIGIKLDEKLAFVKPEDKLPLVPNDINRPELFLFAEQDALLNAQYRQLQAKNRPKLGLFLQGGYGNPGLNMLKNEFTPYYIAGVRLSWNFGNLYTRKNENYLIDVNRKSITVQKETFLFNTNLQLTQGNTEVEKLIQLMKEDNEIIRLRGNIKASAEAKVANGALTVTEMLREVTAEDQAKQNKMLHEIQLLMAIYNLKNITNNP